jgi:hypothetical protein
MLAMLAEYPLFVEAQKTDGALARQVANLVALYQACAKRKHPCSQEMARGYEQELRQLAGTVQGGSKNRSLTVVWNDSAAY